MSDSPSFELTLAADCRLLIDTADAPVLDTPDGQILLNASLNTSSEDELTSAGQIGEWLARRLLAGGAKEEDLSAEATTLAALAGIRQLYTLLHELHEKLLLGRTLNTVAGPLLTAWPLNARCAFSAGQVPGDSLWQLSRFAAIRRVGDQLVLESPRSWLRVVLHDARATHLLSRLARPCCAVQLVEDTNLDIGTARRSLDLLGHCQLVVPVGEDGSSDEDQQTLRPWQHHDLLFHARSRYGSHSGGYGGTLRFAAQDPPPDALLSESPTAETIELFRPDLQELERSDPPLARVFAQRRSWRDHSGPALQARQLGELLYRAARVVEVIEGAPYTVARRPFPSGGGAYELEIYPVIGNCQDLERGLYRYLPQSHRLAVVCGATPKVQELLTNAGHIARMPETVQVLLILAARFQRVSWKYESMAYATVLKNVGVVYQTVYLAATAMGLGACALGGGDSDSFAQAAGLDPYEQTSVGEILLGSLAPPSQDQAR